MTTAGEDAHPVPESIPAAVGLRVTGLSTETRRMLQLASVFTAGFGFSELAAMTDLAEGPLLDCVEEALAGELVHALGAESGSRRRPHRGLSRRASTFVQLSGGRSRRDVRCAHRKAPAPY
jgi:hypothetical protein